MIELLIKISSLKIIKSPQASFTLIQYVLCDVDNVMLSTSACLSGVVVSVIDSYSYDWGSIPGHGNHIIRYALNNIQFI